MILLDSLYINNAGGKVLLDYLVFKLEESNVSVFYLFDDRCKKDFTFIPNNRKFFLKASLINRYRFYSKHSHRFSKIVCFGNLPPLRKYKQKIVFTYFHQPLFLELPESLTVTKRFIFSLKIVIISILKKNTDFWIVQSQYIKKKLSEKFLIREEDIIQYPFYPPLLSNVDVKRVKMSFVYVSNAGPHKNHKNLINEFVRFYDKYKVGNLTLTIDKKYEELYSMVGSLNAKGYPINNLGFISRDNLAEIYQSHEYLIFPSLAESFGLGIVEAIENGCKVIGADLPYLYEICIPSLVFNPYQKDCIYNALSYTYFNNLVETRQKVFNQINDFIKKINQ